MTVVIAVAAFLIGFSKAGLGGTLGPFVTVLVALTMPADEAIGLLLPILVIADLFAVAVHWGQWDRPILIRLLVTAGIGIVAGSFVISSISEPMLRRIIAVAMLGFVAYYFWAKSPRSAESTARRRAWPAGLIGGVTSTLAHLGSPPIMAYLMTTGLRPRPLVATTVGLFAGMNILKIPGYLAAGLLDADLILATAWTWMAIPVGVVAGRALVDRIDRTLFDRMTAVLLVAGASVLLVT